jgi:regulator of sigma E protease
MPDSPAAVASLPAGFEITELRHNEDSISIETAQDAITAISKYKGQNVDLTLVGPCSGLSCEDNKVSHQVYLRTDEETPSDSGSLGVAFDSVVFTHYPWWEMPFRGAWHGLQQAVFLGREILMALGKLGQDIGGGKVPQDLAGPVGIVHQAQSAGLMSQGWLTILNFAGLLSVNLAIMNILPIPPLDGGRAVLILLEKYFDKNKLAKVEYFLNYGGYLVLVGLIILVTIQDVIRIVK